MGGKKIIQIDFGLWGLVFGSNPDNYRGYRFCKKVRLFPIRFT